MTTAIASGGRGAKMSGSSAAFAPALAATMAAGVVFAAAALCLAGPSPVPQQTIGTTADGRFTTNVDRMSREKLVQEIARVTGAQVSGEPLPGEVSLRSVGLRIEQVLDRALCGQSYTLLLSNGRLQRLTLLGGPDGDAGDAAPSELSASVQAGSSVPEVLPALKTTLTSGVPFPAQRTALSVAALRAGLAGGALVSVPAPLASLLGRDRARLEELFTIALDGDVGAALEAFGVLLGTVGADDELRQRLVAWSEVETDARLGPLLRSLVGKGGSDDARRDD